MSLDGYSLCQRVGISHRQLNYWVNRDYLFTEGNVRGTGNHHFFSPDEVRIAYDLAALVNAGVTPKVAAKIARGNCPEYQALGKAIMKLAWRGTIAT